MVVPIKKLVIAMAILDVINLVIQFILFQFFYPKTSVVH